MLKCCFDCDDTMYNLAEPFYAAMHEFLPEVFENGTDLEVLYQDYRQVGDYLFDLLQAGVISPDDSGILRIVKLCEKYGLELDLLKAWDFQVCYKKHQYNVKLSETMFHLLNNFPGKTAVITNGQELHQKMKLHALKAEQVIDKNAQFTSQQLGFRKPDPRCFQEAFQRMQEDLHDWYYIGDSYENDMEGAKSAGMKTIHFNRHHQKEGPASDYVVYTEEELLDLLKCLAEKTSVENVDISTNREYSEPREAE